MQRGRFHFFSGLCLQETRYLVDRVPIQVRLSIKPLAFLLRLSTAKALDIGGSKVSSVRGEGEASEEPARDSHPFSLTDHSAWTS